MFSKVVRADGYEDNVTEIDITESDCDDKNPTPAIRKDIKLRKIDNTRKVVAPRNTVQFNELSFESPFNNILSPPSTSNLDPFGCHRGQRRGRRRNPCRRKQNDVHHRETSSLPNIRSSTSLSPVLSSTVTTTTSLTSSLSTVFNTSISKYSDLPTNFFSSGRYEEENTTVSSNQVWSSGRNEEVNTTISSNQVWSAGEKKEVSTTSEKSELPVWQRQQLLEERD